MPDREYKNEGEDIEMTGEDNADDIELVDAEVKSNDKLKDLRDKLKVCESEKMEHLEALQRAKAEFLNARKRLEDEKTEAKERATDKLIEQLLPMYDSFSMAMNDKERWEEIDENWRKGVEAIYSQLKSVLQSHGVTEVNPIGQAFDPEHHEAMGHQEVTDQTQHDTVVNVLQIGFARGITTQTRYIRPARVIIGNFTDNQ